MDNIKKTEVVQRYVDILTNSGFKALFADHHNKEAVISIINTFLPEHRKVADILYMPTEQQGQMVDNKEFRYDFICKDQSGVMFIVEMQRYAEDNWFKRCVSYASRVYDRQNRRGEEYDVPPVYLIGLMGVDVGHQEDDLWKDEFVSEYTFREKRTHELLDETISIIFVEMARFTKEVRECTSEIDRMIYILKNMGRLHNQPPALQKEIYSLIFEACEIAMFDEAKRIQYDKDMYDERRHNGELKAAEKIGLEKGREEGRIEGREEGREEGKILAAKQMVAAGIDVKVIADALGIALENLAE